MSSQRGSAALLGLIMMMLLGSMGATLLMLSKTDVQIATSHRDGIAAQYWAEAGIQHAIVNLKTDAEFVSQTENHIITSKSIIVLPTLGSYIVQTGPNPQFINTKIRLITATGMVNQSRRHVIVQITLPMQPGESSPLFIIWNY